MYEGRCLKLTWKQTWTLFIPFRTEGHGALQQHWGWTVRHKNKHQPWRLTRNILLFPAFSLNDVWRVLWRDKWREAEVERNASASQRQSLDWAFFQLKHINTWQLNCTWCSRSSGHFLYITKSNNQYVYLCFWVRALISCYEKKGVAMTAFLPWWHTRWPPICVFKTWRVWAYL